MTAQTFYNLLCDEDERGMFTQAGHKTAPSFKQPSAYDTELRKELSALDRLIAEDMKRLPTEETPNV